MSLRALLLAAAALASAVTSVSVASCADEGCAADTDCADGEACEDGACVRLELGGAGTGNCRSDDECSAGERCLTGRCTVPVGGPRTCAAFLDGSCAADETCAPAADAACADPATCPALLLCVNRVGESRGGYACASDEQCDSGRCVEGACFRPCQSDGDCPAVGFRCGEVALAEGLAKTCRPSLPDGTPAPGRAACRGDDECPDGLRCRYVEPFLEAPGLSLCAPERGGLPDLAPCGASADCDSGLCTRICPQYSIQTCRRWVCVKPCGRLDQCPEELTCLPMERGPIEGAPGTPLEELNTIEMEGEVVKHCQQPFDGCLDDVDCCPEVDSDGKCVFAANPDPSFCGFSVAGARLRHTCNVPVDGKAPSGTACAEDAECATSICAETVAGRVCTSLCDPFEDRCTARTLPGSTCQATSRSFDGRTVDVHVCL